MAHFAELDENNIVTQVIVVSNNELLENDIESEQKGIEFCKNHLGGKWIQTSYNGNIRKNFASIGYSYDESRNAFIPPKLFNSWILNENTCQWEPPIAYPTDDLIYEWNEEIVNWKLITK